MKKNALNKLDPVLLIGMGRSGSTIIYELLSTYKEFAWFSNYNRLFKNAPYISIVCRLFGDLTGKKDQGLGVPIGNKFLPTAIEGVIIWEKILSDGFTKSFMVGKKPGRKEIDFVRNYLNTIIRFSGKKRFIAKFTGPPRIKYLNSIFPEAHFIDIIRDPRAVVASLLQVKFWNEKGGLDKPFWKDALNYEETEVWKSYNYSPTALAALQWQSIYNQTINEKDNIKGRYLQCKYEEFLKEPNGILEKILMFCGMRSCTKFKKSVASQTFYNMNNKYKSYLNRNQIKIIEKIAEKGIQELGYNNN